MQQQLKWTSRHQKHFLLPPTAFLPQASKLMKPIIQNIEFSNHIGHCKYWRGEGHFPGMALLIQPLKLLKIKLCTKLQKYKQIKARYMKWEDYFPVRFQRQNDKENAALNPGFIIFPPPLWSNLYPQYIFSPLCFFWGFFVFKLNLLPRNYT